MINKVTPTLTLARLFEAQHQLVDALAIYNELAKIKKNQEIENKITELTERIFGQTDSGYNELINQIFSARELKYFRILPDSVLSNSIQCQKKGERIEDLDQLEDVVTSEESFRVSLSEEDTSKILPPVFHPDNYQIPSSSAADEASILLALQEIKSQLAREKESFNRRIKEIDQKLAAFDPGMRQSSRNDMRNSDEEERKEDQ
ncbi:MAG: hypothetical protein JW784_00680 [Candidatus Cloacimonetes bacterium]|nr:hypothetical protein [Candidatus Cloacimonadota bacterium]